MASMIRCDVRVAGWKQINLMFKPTDSDANGQPPEVKAASAQTGLSLRLFGAFSARVGGAPVAGLHLREGERLLAYLALHAGQQISYRAIAERFWPAEARGNVGIGGDFPNIRQAIRALRVALGQEAGRLASPARGVACLDLTGADVDLLTFDTFAHQEDPAAWRIAVESYRHPLLEGWTDSWVRAPREQRQRTYVRLLYGLLDMARQQESVGDAENCLRRLRALSPLDEDTMRSLMGLLGGQGRYSEALDIWTELEEALRREKRSAQPETVDLAARLRTESLARISTLTTARGGGPSSVAGTTAPSASFNPQAESASAAVPDSVPPQPILALQPPAPQAAVMGLPAERGDKTVVLLYKRGAEPDETLATLLDTALQAAGYAVFIDRNLVSGVRWAQEIERQIRRAYGVAPLISAASFRSEMLEFEIEKAYEAAQMQGGLPRLLPVRVNFDAPLPEGGSMAALLNPLQQLSWTGPADNDSLISALLQALEAPTPQEAVRLEPGGGAVPLDSRFYIMRQTDEEFRSAVARCDSIVLVKGARQMGKTSLLARALQEARQRNRRVVLTDAQTLNAAKLASTDSLYLAFATEIALQLELDISPRKLWDEELGANVNLEMFLRRILKPDAQALVWGIDEVDRLFACPFSNEVFGLFRSWHNRRALDPAGPWSRLTLAIAYATEAHLFITDNNQSPFNVGTRIALEDFTPAQVTELNGRYGAPLRSSEDLSRFYALFNGQPYLVRRGFDEMVGRRADLATLEAQGDRDEGPFGDHLRRLLAFLAQREDLLGVMRELLQGATCSSLESFYQLRSAGLIAGDSLSEARPRCRLYADYFKRHLFGGTSPSR
jgi:DNA-binding SARP family transcriptional activator